VQGLAGGAGGKVREIGEKEKAAIKLRTEREAVFTAAARYFRGAMVDGSAGMEYATGRGWTEETIKGALAKQAEADREAGVDTGIYDKLRQEYEGKKGKIDERKQQAIGNALMQTGIALLGARRGQEFTALSEGGQKALAGLVTTNEKLIDYQDKLEDKQRELLIAENDYKRTKSKSALDRVQSIESKRDEIANKTVDAQNRAAEHRETIEATMRGQDLSYRAHMAQIGAMFKPSEIERAQATYDNILKTQGADAAAKWLQTRERMAGAGRAQASMGSLADKANDNIAAREKDNIILAQEYARNPQKRAADVQAEFMRLQQAYYGGATASPAGGAGGNTSGARFLGFE